MRYKSGRKWLNGVKDGSTGAVMWRVDEGTHSHYVWASLEVRDCSRSVSIDLAFSDEAGRKKMLRKLSILQRELDKLGDAMEAAKLVDGEKE